MPLIKIQGIFLPIAIPFDHHGSIWEIKLQHNVDKWNRTSLAGYVVPGPEAAYLSTDEKIRVWQWTAKYAAPGKILIANCGMPSVHETVELANRAADLGYKAALVCPTHEDSAIYFQAVADRAKIPVIACGNSTHPNIAATVVDRVEKAEGPILAGSALRLADSFATGASGAMLALANAIPYATIGIWEAHRTREVEAALDWQNRIARAAELVEKKFGIPGLKHAMDLNGYYGGPPRLPLTVLMPEARKEIEQAFDGIKG
ncbi:MAG: dihydrodipicolinate synthase family protein [Bryobacteraceae bacterium]